MREEQRVARAASVVEDPTMTSKKSGGPWRDANLNLVLEGEEAIFSVGVIEVKSQESHPARESLVRHLEILSMSQRRYDIVGDILVDVRTKEIEMDSRDKASFPRHRGKAL